MVLTKKDIRFIADYKAKRLHRFKEILRYLELMDKLTKG